MVNDRFSEIREENIRGEGKGTKALVESTVEIKAKLEADRQLPFDRVWVVFDKDDFSDFNEAIRLAESYSFHSAWTNEAFELWYLLHFQYMDAAIGRKDYIVKLENEIRKRLGNASFVYEKNDVSMYSILKNIGDEDFAKRNAVRLRTLFKNADYKTHKPCTTVDLLVEELENPTKVLEKIME